jgi:hypothetical protein
LQTSDALNLASQDYSIDCHEQKKTVSVVSMDVYERSQKATQFQFRLVPESQSTDIRDISEIKEMANN